MMHIVLNKNLHTKICSFPTVVERNLGYVAKLVDENIFSSNRWEAALTAALSLLLVPCNVSTDMRYASLQELEINQSNADRLIFWHGASCRLLGCTFQAVQYADHTSSGWPSGIGQKVSYLQLIRVNMEQ